MNSSPDYNRPNPGPRCSSQDVCRTQMRVILSDPGPARGVEAIPRATLRALQSVSGVEILSGETECRATTAKLNRAIERWHDCYSR